MGHKYDIIRPLSSMAAEPGSSGDGDFEQGADPAAKVRPGVHQANAARRIGRGGGRPGSDETPGSTTIRRYGNAIYESAVRLRSAVGWWERNPVYQDRRGILDVPQGIDVRRFTDSAGVELLVIENWELLSGLTFRFLGSNIAVPVAQLSILEL